MLLLLTILLAVVMPPDLRVPQYPGQPATGPILLGPVSLFPGESCRDHDCSHDCSLHNNNEEECYTSGCQWAYNMTPVQCLNMVSFSCEQVYRQESKCLEKNLLRDSGPICAINATTRECYTLCDQIDTSECERVPECITDYDRAICVYK